MGVDNLPNLSEKSPIAKEWPGVKTKAETYVWDIFLNFEVYTKDMVARMLAEHIKHTHSAEVTFNLPMRKNDFIGLISQMV